jgi:hypothetical protein
MEILARATNAMLTQQAKASLEQLDPLHQTKLKCPVAARSVGMKLAGTGASQRS